MDTLYSIKVKDINGEETDLARYRGNVILVVNVASKCGFTPQYENLQKLHDRYKNQGLKILAFPCNDFMDQEPGSDNEIKEFCQNQFHVEFEMFSKIEILGSGCHPLYQILQGANLPALKVMTVKSALFKIFKTARSLVNRAEPLVNNGVQWNFHKFLVDRTGIPVAHFSSETDPLDPALISRIEKQLLS